MPAPPAVPDHELLVRIGRGSYGEVWLARNVMGTLRAIKVVRRATFDNDRPYEREFAGIQKYEPVSRSHDGLVQVLHVGRNDAEEFFYYVMELADPAPPAPASPRTATEGAGVAEEPAYSPRTLRHEIQTVGCLPLDHLLPASLALVSALGHLHQSGLVHRDLKPSNIIFVQGRPKLADVGLVAGFGEAHSFVGTEGFIPPEGPGTPRADLYGLGKVLYEAATGHDRLRFPEIPTDWVDRPDRRGLFEFHEIVLRACEATPERRYGSAVEMQADLAHLQSGRSVRQLHAMERRLSQLKQLSVVGGIALLLALGAYAVAQHQARVERDARQRVELAEQHARERLAESQFERVRANRRSSRDGQRFNSLEVLAEAAPSRPSLALRNEAIASLALADIRFQRRWPLRSRAWSLDPTRRQLAWHIPPGDVVIHRLDLAGNDTDTLEILRIPGAGRPLTGRGAFSADGRMLLTQPTSRRLVAWQLEASRANAVREWTSPAGITSEFAPDGRHLFLQLGNGPVRHEELATGRIMREWPITGRCQALWASAAGPWLAVVRGDTNAIEILGTETGAARSSTFLPHPAPVFDCQWHPARPWLASACADNAIHIWDVVEGRELFVLTGHQYRPVSVAFHPVDDLVASSSWDGTTRLWDLDTGRQVLSLPAGGHELQFDAGGHALYLADFESQKLEAFEPTTERACRYFQLEARPQQLDIWSVSFSPDGRQLAIAGRGEGGWLDLATRRWTPLDGGGFFSAFFESDGRYLITSGEQGLQRWALESADNREPGPAPTRAHAEALGVAGERYNRAIQSAGHGAYIHSDHIHVTRDGRRVARLQGPAELDSLAGSADARWMAAGSFSPVVRVWNTEAWTPLPDLVMPKERHARVAFSPDSRFLITGTADEFAFWHLPGLEPGPRIARENTSLLHGPIAFSSDGKTVAIAKSRIHVVLLDYPALTELATLEAPSPTMLSWLAFSPDGQHLAAAGAPNQVQIWNLRMLHRELARLRLDW